MLVLVQIGETSGPREEIYVLETSGVVMDYEAEIG